MLELQKRTKCQFCGLPILKKDFAGVDKNGFFHTLCAVFVHDALEKEAKLNQREE